jgi:hypothetical protein
LDEEVLRIFIKEAFYLLLLLEVFGVEGLDWPIIEAKAFIPSKLKFIQEGK